MDKTPAAHPKYATKRDRNTHLHRPYSVNDVSNAMYEIQENQKKNGTPFRQRAIARKYHMNESTLRYNLMKYTDRLY